MADGLVMISTLSIASEGICSRVRFGIDYFIDNRNTLTLSQTIARGHMKPRNYSDIYSDLGSNNSWDTLQKRSSSSVNEFRNAGTQLGFKHNFPKAGREWSADLTYNKGKNENRNTILADYYGLPGNIFDHTYNQEQVGFGENKNVISR